MAKGTLGRGTIMAVAAVIVSLSGLIAYLVNNGNSPRGVVNVANWDFYIGAETIPSFTAKHKIRVNYEIYASNEDALKKIQTSHGQYDVVIPSDYMVSTMIKLGLLEKLDLSKIPNASNVDAKYLGLSGDPKNEYCLPYLFGTTGFAVSEEFVGEEISWKSLIADASGPMKWKNRVILLDDPRQVIGSSLIELGYSPNTVRKEEIDQAAELLRKVKPLVRAFTADTGKDLLINGDAWIAFAWNGDVLQVQKKRPRVSYSIPTAGGLKFQDGICIPKGAPNRGSAEKFINHLLDGDVSAEITKHTRYGNTNKAALAKIPPEILNNPASFPKQGGPRLVPLEDVGDALKLYNGAWESVKR